MISADKEEMSFFLVRQEGTAGQTGVLPGFDTRLLARVLAGLFGAGATLAWLTVVLPHSPKADVTGLLVIVAIAYTVAGLLWWCGRSFSMRLLQVTLAWGSTLITGVAYFSGETPSPLVFFYLWVFIYSSYFFTKRATAVQVAYVGVAYAALLVAAHPASGLAAWWVVGIGTLLVAAVVIATLRARSEQLIARLYEAARTDPLTSLLNRRGFRELLDLELERARRGTCPLSLVVGDLDHFKEVNDRSGHPAGDAALQRVAELLAGGVRKIDAAARVGGEEFALILPGTDQHGAFIVAERLRCAVLEEFVADTVPLTISFGIASYPEHGETASSLIRSSDDALYAAKQSGRDRSVIHSRALGDHSLASAQNRDVEAERFVAILLELAEAVDVRFSGNARHSETVGRYAEMMAQELGLSEHHVTRLRLAGFLHDIGKIGIPDAILRKPGSLTDEEFTQIKRHPEIGAQLLEHPGLVDIQSWVAAHHERPDGRGYPLGISGEQITLEARILAVADAYEAMTSDRAYRRSIGRVAAIAELNRCAKSQFDPTVVRALIAALDRESRRAHAALADGLVSSNFHSRPVSVLR